jgi:tetratricopeptide (TPR) repeat protein
VGSHLEAVGALLRATGLLQGDELADQRAGVQAQLGTIFAELGQYDKAKAQLEPALTTARQTGNRQIEANSLAELGRIMGTWLGDSEAGKAYFAEAMPIVRELGDQRALSFILRQLGNIAYHEGDPQAAEEYIVESVAIAKEIGDKQAVGAGLNSLGNVEGLKGDRTAALERYKESLEVARQLGHRGMQSMILINMSQSYNRLREIEEAMRTARQSYELAVEGGSDYLISGGHGVLGAAFLRQGRLDEARRHLTESAKLDQRMGLVEGNLVSLAWFARLRAAEGDVQGGLEWLGLAKSHPDLGTDGRLEVESALEELSAGLPEQQIRNAIDRGARLDFEAVIAGILASKEDGPGT